jgi:hypothetical protein
MPEVKPPQMADCLITPVGTGQRIAAGSSQQQLTEAIEALTRRLADSIPADKKEEKKAVGDVRALVSRADYVFLFRVQPGHEGTFELPPFTVTSEGESAKTKPLEMKAFASVAVAGVQTELLLSTPRPKLNEDVQLFVYVLADRQDVTVQNRDFTHLPLRNVLITLPKLDGIPGLKFVKPLEQVAKEHAPPAGKVGFFVKGLPGQVLFDPDPRSAAADPQWYRYRLVVPAQFTARGSIDLPPPSIIGEVYLPAPKQAQGGKKQTSDTPGRWTAFTAVGPRLKIEVGD